MIDFDLTEEQQLLEQSVREWGGARSGAADSRARSAAPLRSRPSCRRWRSWACSAARCRSNTAAPAWTTSASGIISEELEYVDTSLRVIMSVHAGLNCLTLLTWGTEDQKQRYLVPQAQGTQDRHLRPDRAGRRQRRPRHPDRRGQARRSLLPDRREDVDLARRRRRQLPRLRLDRSREEEAARHLRHQRLHRRARLQGVLERHAEGEVGHPRRQHRLLQDGRGRGAGGEPGRPAGRRLQDRDVRARPGPLHRGRRRDRPDPRLPRRQQRATRRSARRSACRSPSISW